MIMHFWGVRGSVPWATPGSIGHGCNTPCVEIRDSRTGNVLVLDAGSGVVGLSGTLGEEPREVPILLTHYHWDHTQGLPFFDPFYKPGWKPSIWAPRLRAIDLAWVETIFDSPFYPVPFTSLPSPPSVHLVEEGDLEVAGFRVGSMMLRHPGGAFAYRIAGESGDIVYATDHEFGNAAIDVALGEFSRGAAAAIIDAHFTPAEIATHRGWGHSTWEQAAEFARSHHVGHLYLFHHKPGRSDVEMNQIEAEARRIFPKTSAAFEGDSFEF
jgi:phosphoribosyl 1,2-cyclic phosphodiesterase